MAQGLFNLLYLLIASSLNFTLSCPNIWGGTTKVDPLAGFFAKLLVDSRLVDVLPHKLGPTWHNGRVGDVGIGK